jgi:hypothetical protein
VVAVRDVQATREHYASALEGLWSDLAGTLTRLERLAAQPEFVDDVALGALPRLQYSLHRARELVYGIAPPLATSAAHRELAASLEEARDVTGEVASLLDAGDAEGAAELVHEWRGALFRVRLARRRLTRTPQVATPVKVEESGATAAAAVSLALLAAGVLAFLTGAVLVMWPVWAVGLALVAAALLVYRP